MSFQPERLLAGLEQSLLAAASPAPSGYCLALSGGLDSTVLLHALADLRDAGGLRLPLRAFHVDHGLHADSNVWSTACARAAAARSVAFSSERVDAAAQPGASPEAAARDARYGALRRTLAGGEVLLTAHHADDQLETILLQWLRGGGLQAVAGMSRLARCAAGWHARPLLEFRREELRAWAGCRGLAWQEDPSNGDLRFDRNYLRQRVLPAIRERWPAATRTVGRVAQFAGDALALEQEIALADLQIAGRGATLALDRLWRLPAARQRAVLRAWLQAHRLPVPAARTLEALVHDMQAAAADRIPEVRWPGAIAHRYRGLLYAEAAEPDAFDAGEWETARAAVWPLGAQARLELVADVGRGLSRARLPPRIGIAARGDGALFRPAGGAHRRELRKWFQEQGVLPWRRGSIPLLVHGCEIVAVGDISCAEPYAAHPGEPSWRIVWHGRPLLTEAEALAFKWPETPSID